MRVSYDTSDAILPPATKARKPTKFALLAALVEFTAGAIVVAVCVAILLTLGMGLWRLAEVLGRW